MADSNQAIEWYLARDGRQHGPVTDVELQKIIELGYLKASDLVWRQGMAEWKPAETVLNLAGPAPPAAKPSLMAQPTDGPAAGRAASDRARPTSTHGQVAHTRIEPEAAGARHQRDATARLPEPNRPEERRREPAYADSRGPGVLERQASAAQPGLAPRDGRSLQHGYGAERHAPGAMPGARGDPRAVAGVVMGNGQRSEPHHLSPPSGDEGAAPDHGVAPSRTHPQGGSRGGSAARQGFPWRAASILVLVAGAAAGGLVLHQAGKLSELPFLAAPSVSDAVPVVTRPQGPVRDAGPQPVAVATPTGSVDTIDGDLQKSKLWQHLKADFPEWYQERITDLTRMSGESKSEREIHTAMIRWLIDLRRRHHGDALAASPPRLTSIAASFVASLQFLARESTTACYGYISQGEASPVIADMRKPDQRATLDSQLITIFDAVAEGRKAPTKRDAPRRDDYDLLSAELAKRGWTAADLQLFTDARALSRAAPEKVCQMVQDWFAAQLAIEDEAARARLLGEALKPVVAG